MNTAVIGTGGVGGYFGGKLSKLMELENHLKIYFVARNKHLKEIQKSGLLLDTDQGSMICRPTMATDNISELPVLDLCLLCVKSYDLNNALVQLKPKISDKTMILPLLNGVDIYERIRSVIHNGIVFPSCVYVGTHIERPGKVTQRGGACTIHFGRDPQNDYVNTELFNLLKKSKIKYKWLENPYVEIWSKFIFIASFGLITAAYGKTIGEVMNTEELSRQVKDIMKEILQITDKKQIKLPSTIIEDSYNKGNKFPFETKTSFQRDYEIKDKKDERDLFGGTVIKMGKYCGVKTEATEKVYALIQSNKILP
jgi:2-dehydropantoate 2-reductase